MKKFTVMLIALCSLGIVLSAILIGTYMNNNEPNHTTSQLTVTLGDKVNPDPDTSEVVNNPSGKPAVSESVTKTTTSKSVTTRPSTTSSQSVNNSQDPEDDLQDKIDDLNQNNDDISDKLDDLQNLGVSVEEWDKATAALPEKMEVLKREYSKFDGLIPQEYEVKAQMLFEEARQKIYRAATVDEMDMIIEQFLQKLNNLVSQ